ncbi:SRPBCC family protein [Nocardioides hwasunensis]|uniref:SRPBCC family protein n=1 Tax=Nocardioides hwasunensis TaxID=397258 RepID=A0ABR8MC79_9ACTN|nr:SRPBCC family protein [Nocardioides hwasunensis]MBD3913150.1 SRPBCC family protein [Nocardioides hwasunensis]
MADFSLSRSTRVAAGPTQVHALVDDFREWQKWSPWEGVDPELHREYAGPDHGVGSTYRWSGNKKAGEGQMRITESTPSAVVVDLEFVKPFKATNVTTFSLAPAAGATDVTDVTWTMTGRRNAAMGVLGKLFLDKAIGGDFEKGLASLKREAERA